MHIRTLLYMLLVAFAATSCTSYKEITVEKITNVSVREFSGSTAVVDLSMLVSNPTGSRVQLKELSFDVNRKDSKFAHIASRSSVSVPAKSREEQTLTLEIRISNPLSSGLLLLGKRLNPNDFTATGYIKVSSFPFTKKIRLKDENIGTVFKGIEGILGRGQTAL